MTDAQKKLLLKYQKTELNGAMLYKNLAKSLKNETDRNTLIHIAEQEILHASFFRKYTQQDAKPNMLPVFFYTFLGKIFGYTFVIKLFEGKESDTQKLYEEYLESIPAIAQIIKDEEEHEDKLINMLDEERLRYAGSVVLGLNDALVELTGALAGYTLAMQNTRIIAMAGLITGVAATLSMAASGYFAAQAEGTKDALKSSIYTGFAYLITVALLIAPYLLFHEDRYIYALIVTMVIALLIIASYNMYVSVVQSVPFTKRFVQMAVISIAVAAISFGIGVLVKQALGIDI